MNGKMFCPIESLFALKVVFKDQKDRVYYSILSLDKKNKNIAKQRLIDYFLLSDKPEAFKGKYNSAFVSDNQTGHVLHQFNSSGIEVAITNPILL